MEIMQLLKDRNVVAITSTEFLEPVAGRGTTIQPATYAERGYNMSGGITVIDSVQSQANRLEAIFKQEPYSKLVPQIFVNHINLLDVGHRLADAVMAYSSGNPVVRKAFENAAKGDFAALAKLDPTALVLGIWDSRNTGVKVARTLGFTVDAMGVTIVRDRGIQYRASIDSETKAMLQNQITNGDEPSEKRTRSRMSEEGFNDVPRFIEKLGGCIAEQIVRRGVLDLIPLRKYDDALNNYLFGLGLVMLTYPLDHDYRSGTLLVRDADRPAKLETVYRNGKREPVEITHEQAVSFAKESAAKFGVGEDERFVLNDETYKQHQKSGAAEKKSQPAKKSAKKELVV